MFFPVLSSAAGGVTGLGFLKGHTTGTGPTVLFGRMRRIPLDNLHKPSY